MNRYYVAYLMLIELEGEQTAEKYYVNVSNATNRGKVGLETFEQERNIGNETYLSSVIDSAFSWENSLEGHQFWLDLKSKYIYKKLNTWLEETDSTRST